MKKVLLSFIVFLTVLTLSAQVPQGFNYQAIARDASGNPITGQNLQVKLAVMADSLGSTIFWEELFNPVPTNAFGLFTVVMGRGTRQATSTVAAFSNINWMVTPVFIRTQIYYQSSWKNMGSTRLWSVPYALTADDINGSLSKLRVNGTAVSKDSALFEVKNSTGQTIFAVYSEGVRIYVDDGVKGNKGGFAIGGFGTAKAASQPLFIVDHDSIRAYVDSTAMKGTNKGGFAVGGFGAGKGTSLNLFYLSKKNYFIGHQSGINTTTGLYNSFLGYQTGMANLTGSDNVYIGYQAGLNSIASYNVFIGYQAGLTNNSGFNNIFLGYRSGFNNQGADNNVFIGSETGFKTTTGNGNVFLGYLAGHENTTGKGNSYIGYSAGYNNNGGQNSFFGYMAGYYNTSSSYNLYMGPYAGYGSSTSGSSGLYNILLGNYAGFGITTGSYNTLIGFQAGRVFTTGSSNVFVGYRAGYFADTTNYNVYIGRESGYSNNQGSYNTFLGYQAGKNVTTSRSNTFIGYQAGFSSASAADSNNVMIGKYVGYKLSTGHDNIGIGNAAGYNMTTGFYNVMIGTNAGFTNTAGRYNTLMGYQAGENTTSDYGTMIGYLAGNSSTTGYSQVMLGYSAGQDNTGSYNTMLGTDAGQHSGAGSFNTYVGLAAGYSTTGNYNVFIGRWAGYGETATSNKLIIENNYTGADNLNNALIYGDFGTGYLKFNANVDIKTYLSFPNTGALIYANTKEALWFNGTYYSWGYGGTYNYFAKPVTIGNTANPAYMLYVQGATYSSGGYASSDIRWKKDLEPMNNIIPGILQLNGYRFNWRSDEYPDMNFDQTRQIGLIAQDVEKVFPELVKTDTKGYKAVSYEKLSVLLLEGIKEQQKTIKTLQDENAMLKERLDKLESAVSTLIPGQK